MRSATLRAFSDELSKIAWVNAAEAAGLGVLAAPSISTLASKKSTKREKRHAAFETAGLGILAAHPVMQLMKKGMAPMTAYRIQPGTLKASVLEGSRRAAAAAAAPAKRIPLQRNITNWTPETPAGASWKTNPRAISL